MRNTLKALMLVMVVSISVTALLVSWSYAGNPDVSLRYAGDLPVGNHLTRAQERFAKRVDEISNGRVKIAVYPSGQLFTVKEYPRVVPSGALDMAQCAFDKWSGLVPVTSVLSLPYLFDSWDHIWRFVDSEGGKIMEKEMEKVGVKLLFWLEDATIGFVAKKPLHKLEDFKGMRIRAYDETSSWAIKELGGSPTFMSGGEVYMALQRGTVDGALSSLTSFVDRKYYEVTEYFTETVFVFTMYLSMINQQKWNELPTDVQKMLLAAGKETQEWHRKEIRKVEESSQKILRQKMKAYTLPQAEAERWRKACEPVFDKYTERVGDIGRKLIKLAEDFR